jgi:hypothetical protein
VAVHNFAHEDYGITEGLSAVQRKRAGRHRQDEDLGGSGERPRMETDDHGMEVGVDQGMSVVQDATGAFDGLQGAGRGVD